jgi:predicted AAA+ superfamily ATPase
LIEKVENKFRRKYYKRVIKYFQKGERLIGFFGKRGVGKTYMSLQLLKEFGGVYILAHQNEVLRQ